jgi:hypothetical protein
MPGHKMCTRLTLAIPERHNNPCIFDALHGIQGSEGWRKRPGHGNIGEYGRAIEPAAMTAAWALLRCNERRGRAH